MDLPIEMWYHIASWIDAGSVWKSWILGCKMFTQMNNINQVRRFSNHLTTLIRLYPYKPWYYTALINNPLLKACESCACDKLDDLLQVQSITERDPPTWQEYIEIRDKFEAYELQKYKDVPWDVFYDIIQLNPYNDPSMFFNWYARSSHPSVTPDIIAEHPELPWEWEFVLANPNYNWEEVQKILPLVRHAVYLIENPNISLDQLATVPMWKKTLDPKSLVINIFYHNSYIKNFRITWEALASLDKTKERMSHISQNPNLTWDIIHENQHLEWDWTYLSSNTFNSILRQK